METITINGIQYVEREINRKANASLSAYTSAMLGIYASMMMFNPYQNKSLKGEKPKVNVIEEFKLIMEKKSNLSRAEREWVTRQFKRRFEAV